MLRYAKLQSFTALALANSTEASSKEQQFSEVKPETLLLYFVIKVLSSVYNCNLVLVCEIKRLKRIQLGLLAQ